ncbi:hypothetical protein NIES4073_40050 [Kalymmatonema gypsitolerans NIES-4073]|nr:hypothetical protein NIES4073_40050 [Scytonema sp. NIES-4073]
MLVAKLSILKMHHKNLIKVVKDHFLHSVSDRVAPSTQRTALGVVVLSKFRNGTEYRFSMKKIQDQCTDDRAFR